MKNINIFFSSIENRCTFLWLALLLAAPPGLAAGTELFLLTEVMDDICGSVGGKLGELCEL